MDFLSNFITDNFVLDTNNPQPLDKTLTYLHYVNACVQRNNNERRVVEHLLCKEKFWLKLYDSLSLRPQRSQIGPRGKRIDVAKGIGAKRAELTKAVQLVVPEFFPTISEFQNIEEYIDFCRLKGGEALGAAKINPPAEWVANRSGYTNLPKINRPLHPTYEKAIGIDKKVLENCFFITNREEKVSLSFSDFKIRAVKLGKASKNDRPIEGSNTDNIYWSNFRFPTLYGSDQNGSLIKIFFHTLYRTLSIIKYKKKS